MLFLLVLQKKLTGVKVRKRAKLQNTNKDIVTGFYFYDMTITQEAKGGKFYTKTIVEKHIVLVAKPGSKYIDHVTPIAGSVVDIKKSKIFK